MTTYPNSHYRIGGPTKKATPPLFSSTYTPITLVELVERNILCILAKPVLVFCKHKKVGQKSVMSQKRYGIVKVALALNHRQL